MSIPEERPRGPTGRAVVLGVYVTDAQNAGCDLGTSALG